MSHDGQDCLQGTDLHNQTNVNGVEKCKEDCANNDDCGAVVFRANTCWFKPSGCKDDLNPVLIGGITYLKENN